MESVDLSTVGGCATGVWDENNRGVYWYPMADNNGVLGKTHLILDKCRQGEQRRRSGTMPIVMETAHGPECQ
jgi:hypothetical protein